MTVTARDLEQLAARLERLRDHLRHLTLPLPTRSAGSAEALRTSLTAQLGDYILPRLRQLDAPLLAVVGGSTGSGKSTLVNSLAGRSVSPSGVLRPTTRGPVLVHHPDDTGWFTGTRVLPGLARLTGDVDVAAMDAGSLHLVPTESIPAGLALLDAPDIDSVVRANRELAAQLLAAADLWVFVTTAARYADAVPWDLLDAAASRRAAVAIVLDRVRPESVADVRGDLAGMLARHGLGDSPFFVVTETTLTGEGLLPAAHIDPLRRWLSGLAQDAITRHAVVRRTLDGAVEAVVREVPALANAADEQTTALRRLHTAVADAYEAAAASMDEALRDGTLLRGEVLARWQDFVGTGAMFRSLEARVGRLRDQVTSFFRGRPQPAAEVEQAIGHGMHAVLVDQAERAAEQAGAAWRSDPTAAVIFDESLARVGPDLDERAARVVREWQAAVLELVRSEGADRRFTARMLSFGVNGVALALMIVVFASTAGLTGLEAGVAGGSAVVGQRVLEAVFGDQAVRRLAASARADLRRRSEAMLADDALRFTARLDELGLEPDAGATLRALGSAVEQARLERP